MEIEIIKRTKKELVIRVQTFTFGDVMIWTSQNCYGDWLCIKYLRYKSKVHNWKGFK